MMDEMRELARVRADFPAITDSALQRGATALLDRAAAVPALERAGARRRRWPRPVTLFGGAATLAGVTATAVVVTVLGSTATLSPASAATVLNKAAKAALSVPAEQAHGYIYIHRITKFGNGPVRDIQDWNPLGLGTALEITKQGGKSWDSTPWARVGAKTVPNPGPAPGTQPPLDSPTYDYLLSLPTDPAALRQIVYEQARQASVLSPGGSLDQEAFGMIGAVVTGNLLPPALRAAFYKVVATIPGVTLTQNAADAIGRHGIAVSDTFGVGTAKQGTETLVFDTATYRILGGQLRIGSVLQTNAILQTAFVDKIGQQP